jgi:hypothetical protein
MSGNFSENSKKKAPMHLAPGLPDNFDNFINLENRTLQQER